MRKATVTSDSLIAVLSVGKSELAVDSRSNILDKVFLRHYPSERDGRKSDELVVCSETGISVSPHGCCRHISIFQLVVDSSHVGNSHFFPGLVVDGCNFCSHREVVISESLVVEIFRASSGSGEGGFLAAVKEGSIYAVISEFVYISNKIIEYPVRTVARIPLCSALDADSIRRIARPERPLVKIILRAGEIKVVAQSLNEGNIELEVCDVEGNGWFVGQPISAVYNYKIIGMWQEEGLYSGNIYSGCYPGQWKYEDLNEDGKINADDRQILGTKSPLFTLSISNTLSYKNWSLYLLINTIAGDKTHYLINTYDYVNVSERSDDVYRINQTSELHYWTPENRTTESSGIYNSPAVYV